MIDIVLKCVRAILTVTRAISAVALFASVLLNFANVIGRYFFSVSISWAEEAMLFLMVGVVFFGSCAVAWEGRQIRMDVMIGMMPAKAREALNLFAELAFIATAVALTIFAWPVIADLAAFDERSEAANFPLVIPQGLVPLGLSLMAILVVVRLLTRARTSGGAQAGRSHH
ncbi:MAG TPA: TRAP transporter small permease [Stellaceae bacterium]|nr:TRAP transporter small permease [Stellaceae bacterium]